MKNKISLKVLLLSSLVIILLNLLVGYMLAEHAFNNVYQFYANDTKTTLTSIIANLDTNAFKEVLATESTDSPAYSTLHTYLNNIKNKSDITYIYLLGYDQNVPFYAIDGDDFGSDTFCYYGEPYLTETEKKEYSDCYDRLQNGEFIIYDFEEDSDFGQIFSVEAPIFDENKILIGSIAVDIDTSELYSQAMSNKFLTINIVAILAFIELLLIYIIITRIIGNSFKHLTQIIKTTADFDFCDLTLGQNLTKRKDELGEISTQLMLMRQKLHTQAISVNNSAAMVKQTVEQLHHQLATSDEVTQQINASVDALAEGINQQVTQTSSSYEMLTLLSDRIETLNEHIHHINTIITKTKEEETDNKCKMSALNDSINNNNVLSISVENNVNSLASHSDQIENVIDVIANITRQTNLLALNAAIEAARAGEAGRGFSIVSDQISGLSDDTYKSTEEIRDIISAIINDVQTAITTITSLINSNQQVEQDSNEVSTVFEHTIEQIDKITTLTHNISSFANEINDYKDHVISTTKNLTQQAEKYSAITEEIAATTELESENSKNLITLANNLKEASIHLDQIVSAYKI